MKDPQTRDMRAHTHINTHPERSTLTQSGASKGGLHSVAVLDTESPHGDSTCSLFALLHPELTALKRELRMREIQIQMFI